MKIVGMYLIPVRKSKGSTALKAFFGAVHLASAALEVLLSFFNELDALLLGGQFNALGLALGLGDDPFGFIFGVTGQGLGFVTGL